MSESENLPADLSALEARLASLRPAAAHLDRDAIIYEAGFAAALRSQERQTKSRRDGFRVFQRIKLPLASAAIAASVAVFVTRAMMTPSDVDPSQAIAGASDTLSESGISEELPSPALTVTVADWGFSGKGRQSTAKTEYGTRSHSMLALRDAILKGEEVPLSNDSPFSSVIYTPPKTAHQLRAELLPQRKAPTTSSGWQWLENFRTQGEAI